MSQSIISTVLPACARLMAVLQTVVVLPSPALGEVIMIVRGGLFGIESSRAVRSPR